MLIGAFIVIVSVALITAHKKVKAAEDGEFEIHESNTPATSRKPLSVSA